ncbi:MAG: hypothetical protein HRT77_02550 [Halioglobus sp.]|nr:hypothetical protein [Halioglobus sp.]
MKMACFDFSRGGDVRENAEHRAVSIGRDRQLFWSGDVRFVAEINRCLQSDLIALLLR